MQQTIDLLDEIGDALGAADFRIEQHVPLEVGQRSEYIGPFDTARLICLGDDIEFFRAGETLIDNARSHVVVVALIEDG